MDGAGRWYGIMEEDWDEFLDFEPGFAPRRDATRENIPATDEDEAAELDAWNFEIRAGWADEDKFMHGDESAMAREDKTAGTWIDVDENIDLGMDDEWDDFLDFDDPCAPTQYREPDGNPEPLNDEKDYCCGYDMCYDDYQDDEN
jgi:hypothetical protein